MANKKTSKNSFFKSDNDDICPICKKSGSFNSQELFNGKHEELLHEIDRSKEELSIYLRQLKELEEKEGESEDRLGEKQIFNVANFGALQELLEQAEESGEVILFTDNKKNTWQIINRKDINSELEPNDMETKELVVSKRKDKMDSKDKNKIE